MRILGIETSCDETAAAVVEDGRILLSNVISSSVDLHKAYGGVVPEIAARSHLEVINPVIAQALDEAECSWDDIDAIAVTYGPGLGGSLLVGVLTARVLAEEHHKPLYAMNHVEAHIYANFITSTGASAKQQSYKLPANPPALPLLALVVSGGHSQLVLLGSHGKYRVLGRTQDDAVGEAFDKVAKILGLPYPGGPSVSAAAEHGDPTSIPLPKAKMSGEYDFSFSGLKTAVLRAAQAQAGKDYTFPSSGLSELLSEAQKANIAASFQRTALQTLIDGLKKAAQDYRPASIVIGGGVAANRELRRLLSEQLDYPQEYTDMRLCTDNAAMIASLAYFRRSDQPADPRKLDIDPSLEM
jgi:N6-L-threonylcarbamoyladenine synthase